MALPGRDAPSILPSETEVLLRKADVAGDAHYVGGAGSASHDLRKLLREMPNVTNEQVRSYRRSYAKNPLLAGNASVCGSRSVKLQLALARRNRTQPQSFSSSRSFPLGQSKPAH